MSLILNYLILCGFIVNLTYNFTFFKPPYSNRHNNILYCNFRRRKNINKLTILIFIIKDKNNSL